MVRTLHWGGLAWLSPWPWLWTGRRIQRHSLLRSEAVLALKPIFGGRALIKIGEGQELDVSRTATPRLKELLGM